MAKYVNIYDVEIGPILGTGTWGGPRRDAVSLLKCRQVAGCRMCGHMKGVYGRDPPIEPVVKLTDWAGGRRVGETEKVT